MNDQRWKLARYRSGSDAPRFGLLDEQGAVHAHPALEDARTASEAIARLDDSWSLDDGAAVADAVLLAPVDRGSALICAGANYASHIVELGLQPVAGARPFFFLKPPSALAGPAEDVAFDADPATRLDWEAEVAAIVGRPGRDIAVEDALAHVAGYAVCNDFSARGRLAREDGVVPAMNVDWLTSKGADGFLPVGPAITPAWQVPDPQALTIRCHVDGELMQEESTAGMTHSVAELVAAASALTTLRPGDLIATGTPAGVAAARGTFLEPGQEVAVRVDGIGEIRNRVVAR